MVRRFLKLSITLAPIIAFYPVLMLMRKPEGEDAHAVVLRHDEEEDEVTGLLGWYLNLCLTCVEYSGAAVIKLMQWAGSRPDLFGHDFCAVFSKLQDQTTPHRWKYTEKALREAFGEDWRDHLELNGILGSGCIGQVYEGHTIPQHEGETSQKVAVKVLHPQVHEDIDADLDLMRFAVRAVRYLPFDVFANLKWLNMEGVVEEFAGLLKLQLDLRKEAENLEQFNENFRGDDSVEFPKLVKGFRPTENVLVETFCEGTPVIQFCRDNRDNQEMLSKMCRTAIRAVSKMIFLDNFVHGDLHPGNVFVSPDGKRFVLFDVGIVNEYQESDHNAIVDILAAFIRYQGRKAGRLMIDDSNSRLRAMNDGEVAVREKEYIDKIEYLYVDSTVVALFE
jgi:aarF domain-containing kinase